MASDTTSPAVKIGRERDYFSFLGVPRKLGIDPVELERRFRALSRELHPDYFYNASPAERRASLEHASHLNDAYRTLKHPIARISYLLELEGLRLGEAAGQAAPPVPASLLEEVFALNEELDEVRNLRAGGASDEEWKRRLEEARRPIEAKRAEHEAELARLSVEWDAVAAAADRKTERERVLVELRDRMLERNYITNLLSGIERELAG
jgi:molecular chaperone HscB